MIILHSKHSAESIAFIEAYGEGNTVIDWYSDPEAQLQYLLSGNPQPSDFPFVVCQGQGFINPESPQWVNDEIAGLHLTEPELLQLIHNRLDAKTVELIYGTDITYTYDSVEYICSTEGKDNYFQDYVMLTDSDYPYKVKTKGATYIEFVNKADHLDFIKYGASVIRDIVKWGRVLKYGGIYDGITYTGIHNMTFQELKDFTDPRH